MTTEQQAPPAVVLSTAQLGQTKQPDQAEIDRAFNVYVQPQVAIQHEHTPKMWPTKYPFFAAGHKAGKATGVLAERDRLIRRLRQIGMYECGCAEDASHCAELADQLESEGIGPNVEGHRHAASAAKRQPAAAACPCGPTS